MIQTLMMNIAELGHYYLIGSFKDEQNNYTLKNVYCVMVHFDREI